MERGRDLGAIIAMGGLDRRDRFIQQRLGRAILPARRVEISEFAGQGAEGGAVAIKRPRAVQDSGGVERQLAAQRRIRMLP